MPTRRGQANDETHRSREGCGGRFWVTHPQSGLPSSRSRQVRFCVFIRAGLSSFRSRVRRCPFPWLAIM